MDMSGSGQARVAPVTESPRRSARRRFALLAVVIVVGLVSAGASQALADASSTEGAPTVQVEPETLVRPSSNCLPSFYTPGEVLLNGTVSSNGLPTTAYFEYGPGESYGSSTAPQAISVATTGQHLTAPLATPVSSTSSEPLYYRLVAKNADGESVTRGELLESIAAGTSCPGPEPPKISAPPVFPGSSPGLAPPGVPLGPGPSAGSVATGCKVPHLVGETLETARSRLQVAHCRLGHITVLRNSNRRIPKGQGQKIIVTSQTPKAGSHLSKATFVRIVLKQ
jgi:hypothetical protein